MFSLVHLRDGTPVRHVLSAGETVVGRSSVCDLVIDDPSISRRHARFRVHGTRCHVTELGGTNGTFINGRQITEGDLVPGDTIVLGRVAFHVQAADPHAVEISERHTLIATATTVKKLVPGPSPAPPEVAPDLDPRRLLELVRELAHQLVGWRSLDEALDRMAGVVFATIPAERAFVVVVDPVSRARVPRVARMRNGGPMPATTLNRAVIDRVIETREGMIGGDAPPDAPAGPSQASAGFRSFICVPLATRRGALGVIYADTSHQSPLQVDDLRVVEALGLYAAAVLEHATARATQNE